MHRRHDVRRKSKWVQNLRDRSTFGDAWRETVPRRQPVKIFTNGRNDSLIVCPVTVKDDLIGALQIDMFVTDTFHITIKDMKIMHIATSSNDPPLFHEARKWVRENRPELVEVPCDKARNAPGDCVHAMVQGYKEFIAETQRD